MTELAIPSTELALRGLVKRFEDVTAVDHVDLVVEPGTLVALLGPSGCGKTTTLRMIAGLEHPTEGDVTFDGASVLNVPTEHRNIGMVFQRYVLFPHMSVADNVAFGLRMRRAPRDEIKRRVAEVLDIVQLEGLERRFPSQLSGGQQQRVAIARTLVTDPRVLLMDEPLSNLDARLRDEMRAFITSLQKRLGVTTLFVTHDQVEAIELADQIGVMFDGKLVQVGTPEGVFNRPRTRRVADFMGTTNLIPGSLRDVRPGTAALETAVGVLDVIPPTDHAAGAAAVATVRPEHIGLMRASGDPGPNQFRATVADAVFFGGTITYTVAAHGLTLQVRNTSTRPFQRAEEVIVTVPPDYLWVLPE